MGIGREIYVPEMSKRGRADFSKIRKESVSAGFVKKYPKTFRAGMSPVRQQNRGGEGIDEKDWKTQQEEKVSEGG